MPNFHGVCVFASSLAGSFVVQCGAAQVKAYPAISSSFQTMTKSASLGVAGHLKRSKSGEKRWRVHDMA